MPASNEGWMVGNEKAADSSGVASAFGPGRTPWEDGKAASVFFFVNFRRSNMTLGGEE